jgi:hypothetical protein
MIFIFFYFFLVILGIEFSLTLAKQVLYHMSHIPSPFVFSLSDRISGLHQLATDQDPPTYASQVAEITDMYHCAQPTMVFSIKKYQK